MAFLGGILGSPAFGLGLNMLFANRSNQQFDRFQQEQVDPFNRRLQSLAGGVAQGTQGIVNRGIGTALSSPFLDPNAIGATFGQEEQDINRAFDTLRGQTQSDLISRGLGGTTIGASQRALQQRQRRDALGGLAARRFGAQQAGVLNQLGALQGFGQLGIGGGQAAAGILNQMLLTPPPGFTPIGIPAAQRS
jgi:hypothetical protein